MLSQTSITPYVEEIVGQFKTTGLNRIFEILEWIHKNLKLDSNNEYKSENFRVRTASQIIESRKLTGCTDYALVFLSLVRASGFEARYVETIETKWIENGGEPILGHVFAEVNIDNAWYIIDPQGATIKAWYGKRYAIYAKGNDSWDIGIRNFEDLREKFLEYREKYKSQKSI